MIGTAEEGQFGSVHIGGEPFQACFCFCDDLHADTILFTGDDPPEPNDAWIDVMELIRDTAIRGCEERAVELGFAENNCAEVMPTLPIQHEDEAKCVSHTQKMGTYCTEPDVGGDDETGDSGGESSSDTGGPGLLDRI